MLSTQPPARKTLIAAFLTSKEINAYRMSGAVFLQMFTEGSAVAVRADQAGKVIVDICGMRDIMGIGQKFWHTCVFWRVAHRRMFF